MARKKGQQQKKEKGGQQTLPNIFTGSAMKRTLDRQVEIIGLTYHNLEGQITYADEKAQAILGLSLEGLVGKKFSDPEWCFRQQDEQPFGTEQPAPELAAQDGRVIPDVVMGIDEPDAGRVRWLRVSAMPVVNPVDGQPSQVICQISEINRAAGDENKVETQLSLLSNYWQTLEANSLEIHSSDDLYQEVLNFLPNVFTFPENTSARIVVNGNEFITKGFNPSKNHLISEIKFSHTNIGQVEFHYKFEQAYTVLQARIQQEKVLLDALARWLGLVSQINEKNRLIEQLKEEALMAYDQTLEAWSAALETQDKEASGHTQRVTELAMSLAGEMGFKEEDLPNIRRGALLHDIGKLSIPDEILLKPGKLTEDEFNIVKTHPEFAKRWLSQIEMLKPALEIPFFHHERWDGSGYPQGLEGEDIPLAARMFAIVDVWDALISDRPFRSAMTEEQALDLIMAESGRQFDPDVVESFLTVLSREDYIDTSLELRIEGFGQARVWRQNRRVTSKDWQVVAARDLFFMLLAHPRGLTKEQAGLHMWPDVSPDQLDVRFKNTLYRLRQAVGNHVILLGDNGYIFNRMLDYFYDVDTLTARIKLAESAATSNEKITHLLRAVQQYRGEYLPEIDALWVITDRERYRLMYLEALIQLAELFYEQENFKSALDHTVQALEEDPVFEEAHRIAMKVHAATGNQAEVIRQFEACQTALEEHFSIPPSQKTLDLYEALIES